MPRRRPECRRVYSEPDRLAPHVRDADAAVLLGPAPSSNPISTPPKLIAAAKATGCQAVHPGYGFLSERAAFAEACKDADSSSSARRPRRSARWGQDRSKTQDAGCRRARRPRNGGAVARSDRGTQRSEATRLSVMLKGAAGGGGKGMRLVAGDAEVEGRSRPLGGGPKGVRGWQHLRREIPRAAAPHRDPDSRRPPGRVVALGERECSIQRRHQKLIEESRQWRLSPALRRRLSEAATAAAGAVGYVSAGTIEFLLMPTGSSTSSR